MQSGQSSANFGFSHTFYSPCLFSDAMSSMLLAVETSGIQGSVAVSNGSHVLLERPLEAGQRNAQSLVSEVDRVLRELQLTPRDIAIVAVSIGPGSFTGLRVGLTFAKTFAWLNRAALVAVDTLQAIAARAPANCPTVTAVIDAQRSEMFAGTYAMDAASGARRLLSPVHVSTQEMLSTEFPLTGPGLLKLRPEVASNHQLLDQTLWSPTSREVALIGWHLAESGQISTPEILEPVYIRLSYAEEKRVTNESSG